MHGKPTLRIPKSQEIDNKEPADLSGPGWVVLFTHGVSKSELIINSQVRIVCLLRPGFEDILGY